jgi:hypothetical protein
VAIGLSTQRLWSRLRTWLSPADPPRPADLLFVFAGKMERKDYALALLRQNLAPAGLFSVGRFEIRRFSKMPLPVPLNLLEIAQSLPPPQRHYFVFFRDPHVEFEHIPPARFGTRMEVRALARWLTRHPEIRSLLAISTDAHLRRIRLCCRALLPPNVHITYVAAPPDTSFPSARKPALTGAGDRPPENGAGDPPVNEPLPSDLLLELLKVWVYWFLLKFS